MNRLDSILANLLTRSLPVFSKRGMKSMLIGLLADPSCRIHGPPIRSAG